VKVWGSTERHPLEAFPVAGVLQSVISHAAARSVGVRLVIIVDRCVVHHAKTATLQVSGLFAIANDTPFEEPARHAGDACLAK